MKIMQAINSFEEDTSWGIFHVKCCGYFYEIQQATANERLQGRKDYQLLCVTRGRMWVRQEGKTRVLKQGTVLLFKPDEPQIYGCSPQDNSAYYWVHFNGTAAQELLETSELYANGYCHTPAAEEGVYLIQKMIAAISRRPPQYQLKLLSYFTDLLAQITSPRTGGRAQPLYAKLSPALTVMEQEVYKNHTVEEYAAMCSMSAYYFAHCFKAYTGESPVQYRDRIAMDHAVFLLKHTALSIGEIAGMVGVEDPLYFSKKFKKYSGMSPAAYRKSM